MSVSLKAQDSNIQKWIESQYLSPTHRAIIYQVSPQTKKADENILNAGIQEKKLF